MSRATLFSPSDGRRVAVDVGSQESRDLFAKGFKLEVAGGQNAQNFATPTKQIQQVPGSPALYASDTRAQIQNPAALSSMVNSGGYTDTRSAFTGAVPPVPQGGTTGGAGGAGGTTPGGTPPAPAANPYQSYNDAISQLLINAKNGTGTSDLMQQRNALINARFNAKSDVTPEGLRVLSPDQQAALRSGNVSGLNDQLGGVNTAISTRKEDLKNSIDMAGNLLDYALKNRQLEATEHKAALDSIATLNEQFGNTWMSVVTPEEKARLEQTLGIADLSKVSTPEAEKKYAAGMVGEYQFFVEQEKAAGRAPISFNEYQNIDANRKKSIARAGASTTTNITSGVNMDDFRTEAARGVSRLKSGEPWSTVFPSVKALFPLAPNSLIDDTLGKDQWSQAGASERFNAKQNQEQTLEELRAEYNAAK